MRGITGGRGVLGGAVLLAFGFAMFLAALPGANDADAYLYLFLGIAFDVAYVAGTHQFVYLVPGATLTSFGLGILVPRWFGLGDAASPLFLASLAIGFLVIYLLSPSRKIPLVVAGVIGVVALAELFGKIHLIPADQQPYFVPVIVIVTGAYLILEPRTH